MIRLTKLQTPQALLDHGRQWTTEVMTHVRAKTKIPDVLGSRYRHPTIKAQVRLETRGKCAYCETHVTHQYVGDVEHIIPKSVYPRLMFTWRNLSFVCYLCNNNKRDFVDRSCKLLNPYVDDIDRHLRAYGPLIMHRDGSARGEVTHRRIQLNRKELCSRRIDAIKALQNLIDRYTNEAVPALKSLLRDEIFACAAADQEYSFCLRQYISDAGIK